MTSNLLTWNKGCGICRKELDPSASADYVHQTAALHIPTHTAPRPDSENTYTRKNIQGTYNICHAWGRVCWLYLEHLVPLLKLDINILSIWHYLGSPLGFCTLIFDLMRNLYVYNACILFYLFYTIALMGVSRPIFTIIIIFFPHFR